MRALNSYLIPFYSNMDMKAMKTGKKFDRILNIISKAKTLLFYKHRLTGIVDFVDGLCIIDLRDKFRKKKGRRPT